MCEQEDYAHGAIVPSEGSGAEEAGQRRQRRGSGAHAARCLGRAGNPKGARGVAGQGVVRVRPRRRRGLAANVAAAFGIALALALVGAAVPFFIPSYPPGAEGDALAFARYAQAAAELMAGESPWGRFAIQYQVRSIERLGGGGSCGDRPFVVRGTYRATVVARAWMGIPLATFEVGCRAAQIR